jgi:2-polyprenyl-6-methoxyphenol hydroxylase-like FAD-dependent oxidoreductase
MLTMTRAAVQTATEPRDDVPPAELQQASLPAVRNRSRAGAALVIGGGPAGLNTAIGLARLGWQVTVVEARGDPRRATFQDDRSYNLTLSPVGLTALGSLAEAIAPRGVNLLARAIHNGRGAVSYHCYGTRSHDHLVALPRAELILALTSAAESQPEVKLLYHRRALDVQIHSGQVTVLSGEGRIEQLNADLIVAADGANSIARHAATCQAMSSTSQHYHDCTYVSVTISPADARLAGLRMDCIHFAPSRAGMDVAIPNPDDSLNLLMLAQCRSCPGGCIQSRAEAEKFLAGRNPNLFRHVAGLPDCLVGRRVGRFVTTTSSCWVSGRLALVGDAGHAQPAYLGQGVNAALADSAALLQALESHDGEIEAALRSYQDRRIAHAGFLQRLAARHGRLMLAGQFGDWRWRLTDRVERLRERLFNHRSLYQRIVFDQETWR